MKSAFYYQQELRSREFGHLLYNIVRKGVYQTPTIDIVGSVVTVKGGCYVFYDNSSNNEYAIRISYDSTETLTSTSGSAASGRYIYAQFTYNPNRANDPEIVISNAQQSSDTSILLGVIRASSDGSLFVDTTDMEKIGAGFTYPNPSISSIEYRPDTGNLKVTFNGYFQTNSSTKLVDNLERSNIEVSKAYQIYIDQNGSPQIRETITGNGANMGKTILAFKNAGDKIFTPYRYSHRAEITADSLTLEPVTLAQSNDKLANIYTDSDNKTAAGEVILSKVIQRLVAEVQKLRTEMDAANLAIQQLGGNIEAMSNFTCTNLKVTGTATFEDTVNFTGANIHFSNSSLGSRTNPITDLYVTNVLYATRLQYLSN